MISGVPQGSVLGPVLFLIHIADINSNVRFSTVSSFADDTRVLHSIESGADCVQLQEDLDVIYSWAVENNMCFNGDKFEVLRYSTSGEPVPFLYKTLEGLDIREVTSTVDLGVIMSSSASFSEQVSSASSKARKRMGWILRVFMTRERLPMLTLYKSIVLPLLEYCCQLWCPSAVGMIQQLESVQRTFTFRIGGLQDSDYWNRLKILKLYSIERRRERYAIIYVWKILNRIVPNLDGVAALTTHTSGRRGLICNIPQLSSRATQRITTLRENSFAVRGPRLFNVLPRDLRAYDGELDGFKRLLDRFLSNVPDQPNLPNYSQSAANNSLLNQVLYVGRAQARAPIIE